MERHLPLLECPINGKCDITLLEFRGTFLKIYISPNRTKIMRFGEISAAFDR